MSSNVKCLKVNWGAIYDLLYVFHTNFDHMMYHLWETTPWQVCQLDLTFKCNPFAIYHYDAGIELDYQLFQYWELHTRKRAVSSFPGCSWEGLNSISRGHHLPRGCLFDRAPSPMTLLTWCRCNRLRCPLARMSGLQCINMGHNGHGINLYGVSMTLMGN